LEGRCERRTEKLGYVLEKGTIEKIGEANNKIGKMCEQ
jgi:hypothetical protein